MDASALAALPPSTAARYKAFITAAYPPHLLDAHLGELLPPPASLIDASCRERLLLALSASAKVFAVGLVEEANALRAGDAGSGEGSLAGYLSEVMRRRMLEGALGSGRAREAAAATRDAALRELVAAASHSHGAQAGGGAKQPGKRKRRVAGGHT
jgi:hypothetical protein